MYQNEFEVRLKPDLHVTSSELHIHLENHWEMLQLPAEVHLKLDLNATPNEFPIIRKSCDHDFGQELTGHLRCAFIDRSGGEVPGPENTKVRFVSRAQNALAKLPTSSSLPNIGAPPLDARGDSLGH